MPTSPKFASFTAPTDYSLEQERIARNRKLAERLQAEASTPMEMPSAPGVYVSPLSGLAKMLKAYNARKANEMADQESKALTERMNTARSAALSKALRAMRGTPGSQEVIVDEQANGGEGSMATITAPAVAPSKDAAMDILAGSGDPMLSQIPMQTMLAELLANPADKFGKIDPKDYTPDSVRAFMAAGGKDFGLLVPVRKREAVTAKGDDGTPITRFVDPYVDQAPIAQPVRHELANLGGTLQPWNPYEKSGPMTRTATPDALLSAEVTRRGQNLVDQRTRDSNEIAAGRRVDDKVTAVRKEFDDVPEVKNYRTVQPIIQSAKNAPDTPAGDLDLIYAVGKILDPTSVVREGEMALTIKSGSPIERLKGTVQYIAQGKGRLTKAQRDQLTSMLDVRVGELKKGYDSAKALYERTAKAQNLPLDQIFRDEGVDNDPLGMRR